MKKRIAINSFFSVSTHFLRMLISMLMTPYLLSKLGKEVYGIMPLVNSIVAFLVLASGGIQHAVGRYATLNLAQKDKENANKYINTAFFLLLGLFSILFIPFLVSIIFLPRLLDLPFGHEFEAQIVFLMLGVNLLGGMLFSPFTIGTYFKQRFELINMISIISQLIYVLFVICAFNLFDPNIILLSIGTILNTIISTFFAIVLSRRLVPSIRFSVSYFDRTKIKKIGVYSYWTILIQATVLVFLNTDYIIINKCIGSSSVTDYSLAGRFSEMLRAIITAIVGVVTPACTQFEADGAFDKLRIIFNRGLRIVILIVIPPVFLLCIFSEELLTTWVGSEFVNLSPLFWVILLPQVIILGAMPSNIILGGMGKVKWVGIVNIVAAVCNLSLSLILVIYFDMGVIGVAIASSVVLLLKNTMFVPFYTSFIIRERVAVYFYAFLKPLFAALPMLFLAYYIHINFDITGWGRLIGSSALCTAVFGLSAYFIAFDDSDRSDCIEIFSRSMAMFKQIAGR